MTFEEINQFIDWLEVAFFKKMFELIRIYLKKNNLFALADFFKIKSDLISHIIEYNFKDQSFNKYDFLRKFLNIFYNIEKEILEKNKKYFKMVFMIEDLKREIRFLIQEGFENGRKHISS